MKAVGLTGGIGAGKSVVARMLRDYGYPVYDSDAEARRIMDGDKQIHKRICKEIHPEAVVGEVINRKLIAEIVFTDAAALHRLNDIVHSAVIADFIAWKQAHSADELLFVESAILFDCGLVGEIDEAILVEAPEELRISRVMSRNSLSRDEVLSRIKSQARLNPDTNPNIRLHIIYNSNNRPVLPQLENLICELLKEAHKKK